MRLLTYVIGQAKTNLAIDQDYELAEYLGVDSSAFSNYKKGKRRFPDRAIATLAEAADLPLNDVLAAANLAQPGTSAEDAQFWVDRLSSEMADIALRSPVKLAVDNTKRRRVGAGEGNRTLVWSLATGTVAAPASYRDCHRARRALRLCSKHQGASRLPAR